MRAVMWLLAIGLVAGAGYFIWRGRQERLREEAAARDALAKRRDKSVQDMRACPKCGAYVPTSDAKNCGKDGCPMGLTLPNSK